MLIYILNFKLKTTPFQNFNFIASKLIWQLKVNIFINTRININIYVNILSGGLEFIYSEYKLQ